MPSILSIKDLMPLNLNLNQYMCTYIGKIYSKISVIYIKKAAPSEQLFKISSAGIIL